MSTSLSANCGSRDRLNVRTRCGWSWCASQIRCTERSESPTAFAIAPSGPVRGLLRRRSAGQRHHAGHGRGRDRRLAGLARLVAQQPGHACFGKALLPAPDHRPADAHLPRDPLNRATADAGQYDPRSLDVLALPVAVRGDRLEPLSVQRAHQHAYCLCHPRRFACPLTRVNRQNASEH